MDTLIQIAAACGPIALAIMGVVVSLNPPDRMGCAHKIWASSFAFVGVLAAFAIFFELRGTDQLLGQIWEHVRDAKNKNVPAMEGRHLDTDQKVRMKKTLKLGPNEDYELQINSAPSCEECELFAEELRDFFNTIPGWTATGGPLIFPAPKLRGLKLISRDDEKRLPIVQKVKKSFDDAGMPLEQSGEDTARGTIIVLVARPES